MPPPDRDSLFEDVYEALPWHLREQKEELSRSGPPPKSPAASR
jgi:pyruvate dehydrogenase E1 component alpha subunit/2-oxoisovalerate dehydrogenase E1 component alpha subunit